MSKITLHIDALKSILQLVNELNPPDGTLLGSGYVEIEVDNSSGIGAIVNATIPITINGHSGKFTKEIEGVEKW